MSDLWLKWNSHLEILSSLEQLFETQSFVDVTIAVEGQLLKAHRVVLCASSLYFNSILKLNTTLHPIIFMRDVKYAEMKAILDFIYKGEAYVSQENIQGFLKTADALKITGLSNISWTESSMNYIQADETSQCDIPALQKESNEANSSSVGNAQKDALLTVNDNSLSNSEYQEYSTEEGIEDLIGKETNMDTETQKVTDKLDEDSKEAFKVAHVSSSENAETLMVLEAPSNISITSVPAAPVRQKPIGRQYTKEDLQHALEIVRQGQMGIKPAARAFNIPVATLHHAARRYKISSPMQQGGNHVASYRNKMKSNMGGVVVVKSGWTPDTSSQTYQI